MKKQKAKHTPGPWAYEKCTLENSGINLIGDGKIILQNIKFNDSQGFINGAQNAALIAAAPEMLGALIQARGLIVQLCNDVKNNYGLDLEVNKMLRARGIDEAINKARGES